MAWKHLMPPAYCGETGEIVPMKFRCYFDNHSIGCMQLGSAVKDY